jgi:y4mF family transcriptional regulator
LHPIGFNDISLTIKQRRYMEPNRISIKVKELRKKYNLTQEDLALKSGVGLRFLRELEQGKPTVRMDKINQVLNLFNLEVGVCDKEKSL